MEQIGVLSCEHGKNGKYKITFDNGVSCNLYRVDIKSYQIKEEVFLSKQQYDSLMNDVVGKRAKKRAMFLLEQMDRSETKLREKLEQNGYPQESIDLAVDYVKKFHYLDDERYAKNYVRYSGQKLSKQQVRQKLLQKGISRTDIDLALEEEYTGDEKMQIRALLDKRGYSSENVDPKERQRTFAFLARRGFRTNDILSAMKMDEEF